MTLIDLDKFHRGRVQVGNSRRRVILVAGVLAVGGLGTYRWDYAQVGVDAKWRLGSRKTTAPVTAGLRG